MSLTKSQLPCRNYGPVNIHLTPNPAPLGGWGFTATLAAGMTISAFGPEVFRGTIPGLPGQGDSAFYEARRLTDEFLAEKLMPNRESDAIEVERAARVAMRDELEAARLEIAALKRQMEDNY